MPEIESDKNAAVVSPQLFYSPSSLLRAMAEQPPCGCRYSIRKRGGRKLVLAPDGTSVTTAPVHRHIDNAINAFAWALFWRRPESGATTGQPVCVLARMPALLLA
jgi:hypothetical protein